MFKQPRQIITDKICEMIEREVVVQDIEVIKATQSVLKQIHKVSEEISSHELPKIYVRKKLPKNLGEGLFLRPDAKPIKKGSVIAPYAGEVSVVQQEASDDSEYAFEPIDEMVLTRSEQKALDPKSSFLSTRRYAIKLDAYKKGNFTRSINHSSDPNVEAELVEIGKNSYGLKPMPLEVIYFAKKTIHPGEQLLVSYEGEEDSYWEACDYEPFHMTPKTFQVDQQLDVIFDPKK